VGRKGQTRNWLIIASPLAGGEVIGNTDNDNVRVKALALAKDAGKEAMDLELRGEYVKRAMDAATEIKKRLDKLPHYQQQQQQQQSQSDQQTSEEEEIEEEEEEQEAYAT
jgi:Ran GTPase-activating protein (RanGAP) involved in mRNA processing and transport